MSQQSNSPNISEEPDEAEAMLQVCLGDWQIDGLIGLVAHDQGIPRDQVTNETIEQTLARYAEA